VDVLSEWSLEPLQLAPLAVLALAYGVRARTLRSRGMPVPTWRICSFGLGIGIFGLALVSPVDHLGEEQLFSAHMLQHVMLGDLAPLAIVAGLTGPLLRPLLAVRLISALRPLAHPLIALPLWALDLLIWHLPTFYDAALRADAVHALEHACFFGFGALMWAPVVEVLPGPAWFGTAAKAGYIVVVRLFETVLGNVFLWSGHVFYDPYARAERIWGLSPLADQGIAGGVMMIEGSLVTLAALAWLFLRLWSEGELRQELIERGLDAGTVQRAVRYGRAERLQ
jgi:cytochrome c oxidase assembly factor CtaG